MHKYNTKMLDFKRKIANFFLDLKSCKPYNNNRLVVMKRQPLSFFLQHPLQVCRCLYNAFLAVLGLRMALKEKEIYIRLSWSEKDKRIVFEPQDNDKFSLTVEEAIEACKVYDKEGRALFRKQFEDLLNFLGNWSYEQKEKIHKIFVTVRDKGLLFLVITNSKKYDAVFDKLLTELDLYIATSEDFSEIKLSVQDLPYCDKHNYGSFCNPEFTLEYTELNGE